MNWDAIGAIGELIGAIAVFATLVYLAVQVRHSRSLLEENKRIALSQVHQARTGIRISSAQHTSDSTHLAEVLARINVTPEGISNFEKLSKVDVVRLRAHFGFIYHHQDSNLYQYELGLLDERTVAITYRTIKATMPIWQQLRIADNSGTGRVEEWYERQKDDA